MKARTFIIVAMALVGLSFVPASHAQSTTVRGQLLHQGRVPAAGIQVTLLSPTAGRSSPSMTDNNGMFYLYNVPFGSYYLEVWISNPAQAYPVQISTSPYNDLPRLPIP
jgi:hypothetical protein